MTTTTTTSTTGVPTSPFIDFWCDEFDERAPNDGACEVACGDRDCSRADELCRRFGGGPDGDSWGAARRKEQLAPTGGLRCAAWKSDCESSADKSTCWATLKAMQQ
jgi:hypothetical protein